MQQTKIERRLPLLSLARLVLAAYIELLRVDIRLARKGFPLVYEIVRDFPVSKDRSAIGKDADISRAVDLACVFYFKEARCLQRSAVATVLLRRAGLPAEMVIGIQPIPFRAHSWVEVAGRIVNDKPYTSAMYVVMDRC
jgi:Transglutaminase-like superfamily